MILFNLMPIIPLSHAIFSCWKIMHHLSCDISAALIRFGIALNCFKAVVLFCCLSVSPECHICFKQTNVF